MSRRVPSRLPALAVLMGCGAALAGCAELDIRVAASHLPPYQNTVDRPKNLIDTALDLCPDKTEEREAACVRQALADRHTSMAALVALVPGCRAGQLCAYHHTTEDRLGYVAAIAEDFVAHWTVTFDLKHTATAVSEVPITATVGELEGRQR